MIGQAVEVILDGQVLTEVQVLLQLVAVSIELTVEVLENEPVGVKQLLRAGKTQGAQQQVLKLIVGDTVLLTGADVRSGSRSRRPNDRQRPQ